MSNLRKTLLQQQHKKQLPQSFLSRKPNYTPVKWQEYFDSEDLIELSSNQYHVYRKGNEGPIILCLHGGGYNGLTWSLFTKEIFANIHCRIVALDFRGHGKTKTTNDTDLSIATLTKDTCDVANYLSQKENVPIILIGHSMGGAVAIHASYGIDDLVGLCIIDVVEGTALDALSSMQSLLRGRPTSFKSIPHAIQWCYKGGQSHNLDAARVSMPGQIINAATKQLACDEWADFDKIDGSCLTDGSNSHFKSTQSTLQEVDEEDLPKEDGGQSKPPLPPGVFAKPQTPTTNSESDANYLWRINLSSTEPYWQQWFQGLSDKFLCTRIPKVLILANIHGLDTALTVGQMQGKFQLQVLNKTGHAVQEDQPQQVAEILSIYLVKQKCVEAKDGFNMPLHPNACC